MSDRLGVFLTREQWKYLLSVFSILTEGCPDDDYPKLVEIEESITEQTADD